MEEGTKLERILEGTVKELGRNLDGKIVEIAWKNLRGYMGIRTENDFGRNLNELTFI